MNDPYKTEEKETLGDASRECVANETDMSKDYPREINTYDAIPVAGNESGGQIIRIFKKVYSILAILTLLMSVVFSSAELFDVIINDTGTSNAIVKRIFGTNISDDSFNLREMIISNSFLSLSGREESPKEPESDAPETEIKIPIPNETNNETQTIETPKEPEESFPAPEVSDAPQEGGFPILPMDMSLISYGEFYIYNDTALTPDISSLSKAKLNNYYTEDEPLVLIVHTHGTESFMPEGAKYYSDDSEIARSDDPNENMIAVGIEFARVLEENGIKTIHCVVMHDKESYRESYSRAAESIAKYLREYPSIKYVFDLHRDSIMRSGGELISAVASVNGENHAQIMPVIGTGANDWGENMTFALKLRSYLNGEYTNMCRPICLRESTYNQNMSAISVLIEIGTSGNTLNEAKRAAVLTANAVAALIKGNQ